MCTATIWDMEAKYADAIGEAETKCAVTIREAEATCVDLACTLQQLHRESMQNIEREVIEDEGWDHQSFLSTCGMALQVCPPEAHGVLMYPLQLLTGNMSMAALLVTTTQLATTMGTYPHIYPTSSVSGTCTSNGDQTAMLFTWLGGSFPNIRRWTSHCDLWRATHQRQTDGKPIAKLLEVSHWEAFAKDSDLVQMTRQAYFRAHCPKFNHEVPCNISHTFWEMAGSAGLLNLDIHEVQDTWTGLKELSTANHVARSSSKDVLYFWVVLPTELSKIMGLKPKPWNGRLACCLLFCPWCGKERVERGHGGKPFKNKSLLPGTHLWPVLGVFHDWLCHDAVSVTGKSISTHPWWQQQWP